MNTSVQRDKHKCPMRQTQVFETMDTSLCQIRIYICRNSNFASTSLIIRNSTPSLQKSASLKRKTKKTNTFFYPNPHNISNNSLSLPLERCKCVCIQHIAEALCLRYCKENLGNFLNEYNGRMTQWVLYAYTAWVCCSFKLCSGFLGPSL